MKSIEGGSRTYLTLLESIADTRAGDKERRRIARTQHNRTERIAVVPDTEENLPPVAVACSLYLLPTSPKSDWQYAMDRDISQVGHPAVWGERTDLMEIYRKYRTDDKGLSEK